MAQVFGIVLVTALAALLGGFGGQQVFGLAAAAIEGERKSEGKNAPPAPAKPKPGGVRELKPIVTNLAAPPGMWVRLEAAVVTDLAGPELDVLAGAITTDTIGYLRTLSVADIAGADGLRHLRDDLGERAAVRSNRAVREFIIETLVVQ